MVDLEDVPMAAELTLEQRLANVEATVRQLQYRLDSQPPAANWLDSVIGSFKNDPAFDEVLEYGRAIRQADRPTEDATP